MEVMSDNKMTAVSVSEVSALIKACVDAPIFKGLEVFGEVSGFKYSGPHAYFTLKDKYAQIQCVCFGAAKLYNPKDGESVILRGSLDYYVKGGKLSFQVSSIQPVGKGLLFLEFERLKAKLLEEGIFDEAHKKPIPEICNNVLVLTSKTGAVIRDIVTTVRRKNPVINIVVKDVRVQGDGAAKEIAASLRRVDKLGYDVIVIARGGGSLEDLAPFYDEELVRAVYAASTPIVSAVGHETDFSLCDFAADKRAPTPTAAGELIAFDYYAMINDLKVHMDRLSRAATRNYERQTARTRIAASNLQRLASSFYVKRTNRVDRLMHDMMNAVTKKADSLENRLLRASDSLDKLSPLKILMRGYFKVDAAGKTLSRVADVKVGDSIRATGSDGSLKATVTEVSVNDKK